jgi:hypothetical protein
MLSSLIYKSSIEVMNDCSWMYRDSPQGLRRMNYCNWVQGLLISQHLFREILVEAVLGVHAGNVKIKSFCIQML